MIVYPVFVNYGFDDGIPSTIRLEEICATNNSYSFYYFEKWLIKDEL